MEVKNCRQCGRLFNYVGGSYRNLCPNCIRALEEEFEIVKEYIRDNRDATMSQISEACDVSVKQIEKWVREERLYFADNSPVGISCESCGAMIRTGRYCEACRNKMASKLGGAYSEKPVESVKSNIEKNARMRFLDK